MIQYSHQHALSCSHTLMLINFMFTCLIEHSDGLSLLFSTPPGPMHPNSILIFSQKQLRHKFYVSKTKAL